MVILMGACRGGVVTNDADEGATAERLMRAGARNVRVYTCEGWAAKGVPVLGKLLRIRYADGQIVRA